MKMSAEEIVIMYNQDRSRKTMERIAEINGCSIREVGEFLKAAAGKNKKKPGRPPKKALPEIDLTPIDEVLKDEIEKSENKVESNGVKITRKTYLIPDVVVEETRKKIDEFKRLAKYHEDKMEEYNLMANECEDFLNGGEFNGSKDIIHGQV